MQGVPSVHRGFLQRARSVNIGALQRHAHEHGLRLILCGEESFLRKEPNTSAPRRMQIACRGLRNDGVVQGIPWAAQSRSCACWTSCMPCRSRRLQLCAAMALPPRPSAMRRSRTLCSGAGGMPTSITFCCQVCLLRAMSAPGAGTCVQQPDCTQSPFAGRDLLWIVACTTEDVIGTFFGRHAPATDATAAECRALTDSLLFSAPDSSAQEVARACAPSSSLANNVVPFQKTILLCRPLLEDWAAANVASEHIAGSMRSAEQLQKAITLVGTQGSSGHFSAAHVTASSSERHAPAAMASLEAVFSAQSAPAQAEPDLERGSMDSTTASSFSSAEAESLPQWSEKTGSEESAPMLYALLSKAARVAVLPAALCAYVSIGQQRSLHLPPLAAQPISHASGALSSSIDHTHTDNNRDHANMQEPQRVLTGTFFWRHR